MKEQKDMTAEQVKEKALRLLGFRSHSESELRKKLKLTGAAEEYIDKAIDFCTKYGFLNDENYAVALARDLNHLKKFGKQRIKSELYSKGIAPEYIEVALSEIEDNDDELLTMVQKKLKGDFELKNCDKVIRYFIYRGYELKNIKNAIERLKTDEF